MCYWGILRNIDVNFVAGPFLNKEDKDEIVLEEKRQRRERMKEYGQKIRTVKKVSKSYYDDNDVPHDAMGRVLFGGLKKWLIYIWIIYLKYI